MNQVQLVCILPTHPRHSSIHMMYHPSLTFGKGAGEVVGFPVPAKLPLMIESVQCAVPTLKTAPPPFPWRRCKEPHQSH